jgi:predicted alpha/beta-fold hydrolase
VTIDGTTDFRAPWSAHAWTIVPNFVQPLLHREAPVAEPWSTTLDDPHIGTLTLHGALRRRAGSDACLVVVHGLGGSIDRHYCITAARAAERAGISCLRIALRGADRNERDFYHAGLYADIQAAIASSALTEFRKLYVLGYSLGGHVSLRYAMNVNDARVRAVAAVCAPLDLALSADHIDSPRAYVYRHHVLDGLKEIYTAAAQRGEVPTPLARVRRVKLMREWDALTVVPRFGFGTVDYYYGEMSAGPRLSSLLVPSLLVQSTIDPMVPPWVYEQHLAKPLPLLEVQRIAAGGHVAFPRVRWTEHGARAPLEDHIIAWLLRH